MAEFGDTAQDSAGEPEHVTVHISARGTARAWYSPVEPTPESSWAIACSWTAVPTGRHRLTPDACCDVVALSTGAVWLCGPERRSWTFQIAEGTTAVGVRLRPGIAHLLFGIDVSSITDRQVLLRDIPENEDASELGRALEEKVTNECQRFELARRIASLANDRINQNSGALEAKHFIESVLNRLVENPRARQSTIAAACGLSVRELHRRSLRVFGYGTSTLAQLIRFQRLLSLAETKKELNLASLAIAAGYSDQAHLNRDCRAITSSTPRAFLQEYFPTFPDMADPYKTRTALVAMIDR